MRYALLWAAALAFAFPARSAEIVKNSKAPALLTRALENPLAGLRLEDLSVTRERPLFSPTRRPPPVETSPLATPPPKYVKKDVALEQFPFDLIGVVLGESNGFVLLRNRSTNEVTRLAQNGKKDGWKVDAVGLRWVALERDGRIENLFILDPRANAQSAPQLVGSAPKLPPAEPASQKSPWASEYSRLMRKLKIH